MCYFQNRCYHIERLTVFFFFTQPALSVFIFKQSSASLRADLPPHRLSLYLGSHYFPLLPRHYCFITVLIFFFFFPSLWHLLAKISRLLLLLWNPRCGNTSLGIIMGVRTNGLREGSVYAFIFFFGFVCFSLFIVCLAPSPRLPFPPIPLLRGLSVVLKSAQTD